MGDYAYNDYGDDDSKSSGTASRKEESKRRNSTSKSAHLFKSKKFKSKQRSESKPRLVTSASASNSNLDPALLATLSSAQSKQLHMQLQRPSFQGSAAAAGGSLTPLLGVGAPMLATVGLLHPHRPPLAVAAFPPTSIVGNAPLIAPGPGALSMDKLVALEQAEHRCRMAAAVHSAEARALQARLELKRLEDELEMARSAHGQPLQPLPRYYSAVPADQLKKQGYPQQLGIGLQQQLELQQQLGLERRVQDLLGNDSSRGLLNESFTQVGGRGRGRAALDQSSSSITKKKKGSKRVSASKGLKTKSPKPRSSKPVVYVEPVDNDVLCGRDKSYNRHPGNKVFKAMIIAKAESYCATTTKQEKMDMTKLIVNTLKKDHGARFLKPVKFASDSEGPVGFTGDWEEISDQLARDKVSHALRFTASHSKRKLEIPAGKTMVTLIETTNGV